MPPPAPDLRRWPTIGRVGQAELWLRIQTNLGLAPRTLDAYARGLADYFTLCERLNVDPVSARRATVAAWVRDLGERVGGRGANVVALDSGCGLANATIQQRLTAVRLFYDFLVEEGARQTNPVGRGRYTSRKYLGGQTQRGLVPRFHRLPWIPSEAQWQALLAEAREESIRNRFMLALAYDAALRREELCLLETSDIDPAHRRLTIRAETTKTRRTRVVPYSEPTGQLLAGYLDHRRHLSRARGPLFLSQSPRNLAEPISAWTWSKVVRGIAIRAGVPDFSTHTLRHLRLTDLARSDWDLHAIARFAGHRSLETTAQYVHLSAHDLAAKLQEGMASIHAWRVEQVRDVLDPGALA